VPPPETGPPEPGPPETGPPETGLPETGLPETGLPEGARQPKGTAPPPETETPETGPPEKPWRPGRETALQRPGCPEEGEVGEDAEEGSGPSLPLARLAYDGAERLIRRPGWHEYFMAIAKVVSTRSTCSSRPIGCVIVRDNRIIATGYNGAPPGEPHCSDMSSGGRLYCARRARGIPDRDKLDHCRSLHAEENAVAQADRLGLAGLLAGSTVYSTLSPCVRCIGYLSARGVARVYYELPYGSVDRSRDREWEELARGSFEVFEQLRISRESLDKILWSIFSVTSRRLLPSE
jgi:dCMP deaminase